ncbi:MAG TPA: hypothetical protein VGC25_10415 [Alphaproteobacteria bacterium]
MAESPSGTLPRSQGRAAFVFSHPNHELAVLGYIKRARPSLLFLTGHEDRARRAETVAGLSSIGIEDSPFFLDNDEEAFYQRILGKDMAFFEAMAETIAHWLAEIRPDRVFCDAIEFYHPMHDLAVPLVLRAVRLSGVEAEIFEVPILAQGGPSQRCRLQTVPEYRASDLKLFELDDGTAAAKLAVARDIYLHVKGYLKERAGIDVERLTVADVRTERFIGPVRRICVPASPEAIRYQWRGAMLRDQGTIKDVIRHDRHYLPIARHLAA